ncbi:MAG: cytochrome c biogenesis protein CcdA [Phycisphaerales bacterium]
MSHDRPDVSSPAAFLRCAADRLIALLAPTMVAVAMLAVPSAAAQISGGPGGLGGLGGFGGGDDGPKVTISMTDPDPIPAGGEGFVEVTLDMLKHWHVQAGEGSGEESDGFVSTNVVLSLPEGFTAGTPVWPPAKQYVLGAPGAELRFRGYEGTLKVLVPVTAPAEAAGETVPFSASVTFQACDDSICLPPDTQSLSGTIAVGAVSETNGFDGDSRLQAELAWFEGDLLAGRLANLGVVLNVEPNWYLQGGQGTGLVIPPFIATTIQVNLPDGWVIGDTIWPEPNEKKGYEGQSVVIIPVEVPADAAVGDVPISVTIGYQACDKEMGLCENPTELQVTGTAIVRPAGSEPSVSVPPAINAMFAATFQADRQRKPAEDVATADGVEGKDKGMSIATVAKSAKWWLALAILAFAMLWMVVGTLKASEKPLVRSAVGVIAVAVTAIGFLFVRGVTSESNVPWVYYSHADFEAARADGKTILIKYTAEWCLNCQVNERLISASAPAVSELSKGDVAAFKVDITGPDDAPEGRERMVDTGIDSIPLIAVYEADTPVDSPIAISGQIANAGPVISALKGEYQRAGGEGKSTFDIFGFEFGIDSNAILIVMVLAFIAGFLMNFTPCVLPVIPIKILSLQSHAQHPAKCFALGLIFSAGIVALYAVLGVFMAGLVGGIDKLSWGEHFQAWWLNAIIALIILAMGIGMMGLFTIRLPQFLYMFNPSGDSSGGSFFMGVFTAILSTPCTGPLLGATLAWAALQSKFVAFSTLVVMGFGMASPYVVLTAFPGLLKKMPRTGKGSDLLKQVMGMLMVAVAVWFAGTALAAFG